MYKGICFVQFSNYGVSVWAAFKASTKPAAALYAAAKATQTTDKLSVILLVNTGSVMESFYWAPDLFQFLFPLVLWRFCRVSGRFTAAEIKCNCRGLDLFFLPGGGVKDPTMRAKRGVFFG